MDETMQTLLSEVIQMAPDQRLTLAQKILRSDENPEPPEVEAAWVNEIHEHLARYDEDGVPATPAAAVFEELDRRRHR